MTSKKTRLRNSSDGHRPPLQLGIQRLDISAGVGPFLVELFLALGVLEELAIERDDIAAGVGVGAFHQRDDLLVARLERGDLLLDVGDTGLRLLARGGNGLALLGLLALLLLGLRGGVARLRDGL